MSEDVSAILAAIRGRAVERAKTAPGFGAPSADFSRLLAAVEAVLKLGDRSGEAKDPDLPGYVDVHMIREAITTALAGKDSSDGG